METCVCVDTTIDVISLMISLVISLICVDEGEDTGSSDIDSGSAVVNSSTDVTKESIVESADEPNTDSVRVSVKELSISPVTSSTSPKKKK